MHEGPSHVFHQVVHHHEDVERLKKIVTGCGGVWLGEKAVPCLDYQGVPLFGRFNIECTYKLFKTGRDGAAVRTVSQKEVCSVVKGWSGHSDSAH